MVRLELLVKKEEPDFQQRDESWWMVVEPNTLRFSIVLRNQHIDLIPRISKTVSIPYSCIYGVSR